MPSPNKSRIVRKALLVSPVGLDSNSAGSAFLKSLLSTAEAVEFSVTRRPTSWLHEYNPKSNDFVKVMKSLLARLGGVQVFAFAWYEKLQVHKDVMQLMSAVNRGSDGPVPVLLTLSSPESILLASRLAARGCALYLIVLDDPEYLLGSLRFGTRAADKVKSLFGQALRSAKAVAVISEAMCDRYAHRYNIDPIVIRPGTTVPSSFASRKQRQTFRLAFAGSLYAKQEWNSLIRALDQSGWSVNGKRVVVYFVGAFPKFGALDGRYVVKMGYRTTDEVKVILAKCHAGYLPYWLAPEKSLVASTSFPSKLATYLSCGLPVLHHGPFYTEAARLLKATQAGVCCDKVDADAVLSALVAVSELSGSVGSFQDIRKILDTHLSDAVMAEKFSCFLSR